MNTWPNSKQSENITTERIPSSLCRNPAGTETLEWKLNWESILAYKTLHLNLETLWNIGEAFEISPREELSLI